jgi:Zn-dependent peptidase ImmA (M78 family)/DNA-binding XRE family transcriptional regulator
VSVDAAEDSSGRARVNGEMLLLARQREGLTQTQLAALADVSVSLVSRIEGGSVSETSCDVAARLATAARVTPRFFDRDPTVRHLGFHRLYRIQRRIGAKAMAGLESELNARRLHLLHFLRSVDIRPSMSLPERSRMDDLSPEAAARELRKLWMVRPGVITSITTLMEAAGILIVELENVDRSFEGLAVHAFTGFPIVFVRGDQTKDRRTFTLAHELAHLVLHQDPSDDQETEANRFAAEFIMPATTAATLLRGLTLQQALRVKVDHGVSAQFCVTHAARLNIISKDEQHRLYKQISQRGWRTEEPYAEPADKPQLTQSVLETLKSELGYSAGELAHELGEIPERIEDLYFQETRPVLRLVPPEVSRLRRL